MVLKIIQYKLVAQCTECYFPKWTGWIYVSEPFYFLYDFFWTEIYGQEEYFLRDRWNYELLTEYIYIKLTNFYFSHLFFLLLWFWFANNGVRIWKLLRDTTVCIYIHDCTLYCLITQCKQKRVNEFEKFQICKQKNVYK